MLARPQATPFPFSIQNDLFQLNGAAVFVNMIGYQPLEPGESITDEIRESRVQDDLRRLEAYRGGSDPVLLRVYAQPTSQFPIRMPKSFYDGVRALNFWIVRDIYFDANFLAANAVADGKLAIDNVIAEVDAAGGLDRIFSWEIGNEFQANTAGAIQSLQLFLGEMRDHIKMRMAQPGREAFSNWVTWAAWPPSDPLRTGCSPSPFFGCNPILVPSLDYVSFNAYAYDPERMRDHQAGPVTGTPFGGYLAALKAVFPGKPLVISETGLPDSPSAIGLDQSRLPPVAPSYRRGALTPQQVGEGLADRYWDARLAGNVAGFGVFEWCDEFHKAGDPTSQAADPEEHFGLGRFVTSPSTQLRFKLQQEVVRYLYTLRPASVSILSGLTADDTSLPLGGTTTLHAALSGTALAPVRFRWETSAGRILGDSATVQYVAGSRALGPAQVTVVAIDRSGATSRASLTIGAQPSAPAIELLTFGTSRSSGRVSNIDLTQYKLVLYVRTNQYFVQPFADMKSVWVREDGYWWSTNFAAGTGAELHVWAVPKAFDPPGSMANAPPGAIASATLGAINDTDNDLLPDSVEPNPAEDRYGDPDGDGANNLEEFLGGTSPSGADNDGDVDGLPDNWERRSFGTLTLGPADDPDTVGRSNAVERTDGTNPVRRSLDSDVDGLPDTWEERYFGNLSRGPSTSWNSALTNLDAYELGFTSSKADLTNPAPGSTLGASPTTFQWTTGIGATRYWLYVGTSQGSYDLVNLDMGTAISTTVTGLPADGRQLHVRLHSMISGTWDFNDYVLTAANSAQKAALVLPAAGTTVQGSNVTFQWTAGTGATRYWLYVGSTQGSYDLLNLDMATSLFTTGTGLPTDGRTLYVRLHSMIGGAWQFTDYTFASLSAGLRAVLHTPSPGGTLGGSTALFQWFPGVSVTRYWLYVGNAPGTFDLVNTDAGTNLSTFASGLPLDGRTLFVRLHSMINGSWQFNDYTLTAASVTTRAVLTTPAHGSTLTGGSTTFQWTSGTGATRYWLYVGSALGEYDLVNLDMGTSLSVSVSNLPTDGRTLFVRLHSMIGGTWQFHDFTITASSGGAQRAQLATPAPSSTLLSSTVTFQWTAGVGVTRYWLYVGNAPGTFDLVNQDMGTGLSTTASGLPNDGRTLYVRVFSMINGTWQFNDYIVTAVTGDAALAI
jgi:hypothetical protein